MWVEPTQRADRVIVHAIASHFPDNIEAVMTWKIDQTTTLDKLERVLNSVYARLGLAPYR